MEPLLLAAVIALGIVLADTRRRLARAEARLQDLADAAAPEPREFEVVVRRAPPPFAPRPAPHAATRPKPALSAPASEPVASAGAAAEAPGVGQAKAGFDLESLIGGRLPVWIGGAALVLAGFFLVRAAIDSGWFGPGARTLLACLLAFVLIAASEAARRLPATRDDPRIGQALAGAGVASLYATLYLAAALYHLVAPLPAFVLLLLITGAGLALSLRQGPPTAIMALAGGFLAPLVAGYDAAGTAPLLVYLALLLAALFVLSVRRGWGWLAVASAAAGFGWTGFLALMLGAEARPIVGGFVVLLSIGAALALPASGARSRWLRLAPLGVGLAQLFVLAPTLDFSPLGWAFYLVLAAAAVALAWREPVLSPAPLMAAALLLVLLAAAPTTGTTGVAAIAATLIFGAPGLTRSRAHRDWALMAVIGLLGPLAVLQLGTPQLLPRAAWTPFDLVVLAAAAWLAWRHRDRIEGTDTGLIGGTLAAAGAGVLAAAALFGEDAAGVALAAALIAIAEVARRLGARALSGSAAIPLALGLLAAHREIGALVEALARSLPGEELIYPALPPAGGVLLRLLPLAVAALLPLRHKDGYGAARRPAAIVAGVLAAATAYALMKQPLAIADADAFLRLGFYERAAITLAALAAARALATRAPVAARTLATLAIARIAWFDLLLLSPLFAAQAVGSIPLLNAAVLLPGMAAAILWTWGERRWRVPALALMLVAALAAVRQAAHGSLLTGPVGTGENWGYSAAMLALALVWLWSGLVGGARDLRFAGLGLVMVVAFKVFTVDIALEGILRVVSFLGIGVTLIAISWAYTRFLKGPAQPSP
ncbi:DUF2339 domain-containing protein [Sphingomonas spermidinifaciens]|uniref:DUF2339 domain-containing protein n=1 Tax=Sphingomonas spermidinifaciens TaxID=1141889 RepID=UPI0015964BBE|nr:DUF2339 domain-containing protein [Sphingomonas spermidinifaciens]